MGRVIEGTVTGNGGVFQYYTTIPVTQNKCARCGRTIADHEPIVWGYFNTNTFEAPRQLCTECRPEYTNKGKWGDVSPYSQHNCTLCGRVFFRAFGSGGRKILCSERCQRAWLSQRKRMKRQAARSHLACPVCGTNYTGTRNDQHYCSGACKQKAYRQRVDCALPSV